jgi:guanylate kinase
MKRGKFITVSGPTGSGKSTLMRYAIARFPQVLTPQSYTTRPRRGEAIENAHYTFISVEEFKNKIAAGDFLEWAEFSGNYYGTLRAEIEEGLASGRVMYKEMEVQGVRKVLEVLDNGEVITVFVDAGSWEESKARALLREPMSEEALQMRKKHYEDETTFMPQADVIIHNLAGKYAEAEAAFEAVITGALKDTQVA